MNMGVNRRDFLSTSALSSAAVAGAAVSSGRVCGADAAVATTTGDGRSLTPKMQLKGTVALSNPFLDSSQLSFRINLARTYTGHYPLDRMDFIMIDLERPEGRTRHASWCTGDLTGRMLEFLSLSEGITGQKDPRLDVLFERILKQRLPSGIIGRFGPFPNSPDSDDWLKTGSAQRLSCGLMQYFELTGDPRALEAALGVGKNIWSVRDNWRKFMKDTQSCNFYAWMSEFFAQLYAATSEPKWLEMCGIVRDNIGFCDDKPCHAHMFMSTLRGFQRMALATGDISWNEKAEANRQRIIERHFEMPDGGVCEGFPYSHRNEGCAIADWMLLNLNAGLLGAPDAYEKAERIFWNALAFNQSVTGGFGHREVTKNGYGVEAVSECWWCCVHTAGHAMSEFARHAVTFRDGAVHVNLLTPGQFQVPLPGGKWAKVTVATAWPTQAEATIKAENLPADVPLKLRVPSFVRQPNVRESRTGPNARLDFRGEIGHRIEQCNPGVVLTYGPLVLVPAAGLTQPASSPDSGIPPGYIPKMLPPGAPTIKLPAKPDADGFVKLPLCPPDKPLPDWSYYDEGPGSPLWVEGAPVEVQLKLADGKVKPARFTPMCYSTSLLALFHTPVVFKDIE
jgi:hypothetical protein